MSKPVFIFLPGAWHSPSCYDNVIEKLSAHSYKCIALPLQAVVQQPAVEDLQPDILAMQTVVRKEADEGHDIIVVGHSWSGIIVSGALSGFGKAARMKEGRKGGVIKLAFICAFVPPENTSLVQAFGDKEPEWYDVQKPWVMPTGSEDLFYNDLPPSEAAHWASQIKPHSYATKFQGVKAVAWKEIPSSYLVCENDHALPVAVQEAMVKACQDAGAEMEIERIKSGHSPFLSKPDEVAIWLRKIAGEKV